MLKKRLNIEQHIPSNELLSDKITTKMAFPTHSGAVALKERTLGQFSEFTLSTMIRLVWLRPSQLLSTVYNFDFQLNLLSLSDTWRGRRGRDRMVVGFKTTYAISAYHRLFTKTYLTIPSSIGLLVCLMVLNTIFNNISVISMLKLQTHSGFHDLFRFWYV
jgi:hypothetical protein